MTTTSNRAALASCRRKREGRQPLRRDAALLAATNRNAAMAEALLKAGADANAKVPGGDTILMTAARTGNPEIVRLLMEHGADVNAQGGSVRRNRAGLGGRRRIMRKRLEVLIAHGAEVNARTNPLERAKDRFGLEGVLTILPHGSWTPLMYAARQGSLETARTLVDAGASLNLTDPDGSTALLLAIINGHYDTAALLAEKGADPNIADAAGMAALYAAVDMNTLGEVYGHPARPTTSKMTALDLMKVLLEHGANPNARLKSPTLQRAHTPGEPTLRRRVDAADARGQERRCCRHTPAAGSRRGCQRSDRRTAPRALMFAAGLGIWHGYFRERLCNRG